MAACSVGKCPRARIARRYRALIDSIAFVEQSTFCLFWWVADRREEGSDMREEGLVGDGDVVTVVVEAAEFAQGVECCGDLSAGRGVCGVRGKWWGAVVVVAELLSPALS